MSFAQGMTIIVVVMVLFISLDYLLSKSNKEWETTPWEEDEQR